MIFYFALYIVCLLSLQVVVSISEHGSPKLFVMSQDQNNDARSEVFARKVFWKVLELEQQMNDERRARFAELEASIRALDKLTSDMFHATRAAGRFSRYLSPPQFGFPADANPVGFRLVPTSQLSLFQNAVKFLEHWKRANPTVMPSAESHLKCIADAEALMTPTQDFPKCEFVAMVSENFELWRMGL